MDMASTGLLIVWFVVIVALIPVSLWLLKRSGLANGAMGGTAAPVRTVGNVNLGPGQRIVTVEVGEGESRTWLVLGVTSQQINTLHSMAPLSPPVPARFTLCRNAARSFWVCRASKYFSVRQIS